MSDYENQELRRHHARMRKIVLGFVVIVALIALAYDYVIARPSVDQAYALISTRFDQLNASAGPALNNVDVRKLLRKQPSRIFRDGNDQVEVFSWIAGFPLHTHDLYVVFRGSEGPATLLRQSKFAYESSAFIYTPGSEREPDIELDAVDAPANSALASDRDASLDLFDQWDADRNGQLTADELDEDWRERLPEIDADGDGRISRQEFLAATEDDPAAQQNP